MSLPGIITRTILGLAPAPATQSFVPLVPLVGAPATSAAPAALPAPAPSEVPATAAGIVERVQQFYARITQVTASFHQSVTYATFGNKQESDGKVMMAKPGKMRWDYAAKKKSGGVKKVIVSNGTTVYVVEHDKKQLMKKNVQQDLMPVAVSFLYGKGDLKGAFNAELDKTGAYGAKGDLVLRLTPKQPSAQYKNLYLVVSPKDFHVSQSVIIDSSDNVNQIELSSPDFDTPIPDATFEFDMRSVKDYRVMDADAPGGAAGR
jgi:outer membrane lipoprotein carrier protein